MQFCIIRYEWYNFSKYMNKSLLSPSTQFDSLVKPLLIHGLLHQLSLHMVMQRVKIQQPPSVGVNVHQKQLQKIWERLTISTHSIRGRRTAWLPDRPMTQAGVSGVASNRATTASTPNLLLLKHECVHACPFKYTSNEMLEIVTHLSLIICCACYVDNVSKH